MVTALAVVATLALLLATGGPPEAGGPGEGAGPDRLSEFADNIVSGGPPRDGIPPIENPRYVSVDEASEFLADGDVVFVLEYGGETRIYPQMILVWHEIVNDVIGGELISVTYCPLTGSVIAFRGVVGGLVTTFGTSGKLLNSNLVMYDRATESLWPQILGVAVTGPLRGYELDAIPLLWTRWGRAKTAYPDAKVLSLDTGYSRPYGRDPYGSYLQEGTYYDSGGPIFPVMSVDDRLEPKEVVVGIRVGGEAIAVTKRLVEKEKVVNTVVGGERVVLIYDDDLGGVRAFYSRAGGRDLTFVYEGGNITDLETGSTWSPLGYSRSGELKGSRLERVSFSMEVMWFAWSAFYPETKLLDG